MNIIWSYNGVELPPLPEYDKEKYPYIFIAHYYNNNPDYAKPSDTYQILGYDKPLKFAESISNYANCFYWEAGTTYLLYNSRIVDGVREFYYASEYTTTNVLYILFDKNTSVDYDQYRKPIWTNVDLYDNDGKIRLAASEPVEPTVSVKNATLISIADTIRYKNSSETTYKPSEMAGAIKELPDGLPLRYREYVDYAKENLYDGDYKNLVVWEYGDWLAISFLMEDFKIYTFNPNTTEVTASGWVTCGYTKSTGEWDAHDYTVLMSPGGNYAKHIAYSSCYIYFGTAVLYPTGINNFVEVTGISFDGSVNNLNVSTATGYVEQLAFSYDTNGHIVSITDSSGNVTTVSGI